MTGEELGVPDEGSALDDVFASDRDRGGTAAPSEPEAKNTSAVPAEKSTGTETASEEDDKGSSKQYRDPDTGRFVPLHELKSEREKRQEAAKRADEAEKRALDAEERAKAYERKFLAAEQPRYQQPQQPQPQRQRPDPWSDPEGAMAYDRDHILAASHMQVFETRVAVSEELMSSKSDFAQMKDIFVEAARQNPMLARQMVEHPLPAKFAYEQGKKILAQREVGDDLEAYNQRIREAERAKVIAELNAGNAGNQPPQKFPGTLADATATGAQGEHISREAVMSGVFDTNRRRK